MLTGGSTSVFKQEAEPLKARLQAQPGDECVVGEGKQSSALSITEKTKTEAIAIFPMINFGAIS